MNEALKALERINGHCEECGNRGCRYGTHPYYTYSDWFFEFEETIRAALSGARPEVQGEPVGWQVWNELIQKWTHIHDSKIKADEIVKQGYTVRPVYALPSREAELMGVIRDFANEGYDDVMQKHAAIIAEAQSQPEGN